MVFENEYSGAFFNSAWRRFRKRNAYPTAITQNVEYLLDSVLASTMLSNSELIVMLNQAAADRGSLASSSTSAASKWLHHERRGGLRPPALRRRHRAVRQPLPEGHRTLPSHDHEARE